MKAAIERVVDGLRASKKYGRLCAGMLGRTADWAVARSSSHGEALKRAKRKLHQICGAFVEKKRLAEARRAIEGIDGVCDERALRAACMEAMAVHASSRERLGILDRLYPRIFEITGKPSTVLDIGCGLNPLTLPWMGLARDAQYVAIDADCEIVSLVSLFFEKMGVRGEARPADVFAEPPRGRADVVFLLKMLTTLDQQEKGAGFALLEALDFAGAVVSYPTRSVCGRQKGMRENYSRRFDGFRERTGRQVTRIDLGRELFFVLTERT